MQQPGNPSPFSSAPSSKPPSSKEKDSSKLNSGSSSSGSKRKKIPSPQELVSHYESQGMETQEASMKVIEDLQHVLVKVITSSSGMGKKDKFITEASRKLDTANARLAIVEMKVDSKPGYPETLGIGVASAAAFRGVAAVWPHFASAAAQIWNSVRSSTTKS